MNKNIDNPHHKVDERVSGMWGMSVRGEREWWVATIPKLGIQTNNHRQMTMIAMKAQGSDRHSHTMRVVLRLFYA